MKTVKFSFAIVLLLVSALFVACSNDDKKDEPTPDPEPTPTLNAGTFSTVAVNGSPVADNASVTTTGSTFTLNWTVVKREPNLKSIKIELSGKTISDNAGVAWNGTSTGSQASVAQASTWTNTVTLPAIDGVYKITLTDVDNNTTSYTFTVATSPAQRDSTLTITLSSLTIKMKYVQGGTFKMGAQNTSTSAENYDSDARSNIEAPVHTVTLSAYWILETEVTQALWYAVTGFSPTEFGSSWISSLGLADNYPAYRVSYNNILSFITQLNTLTGKTFRLPTEAEWEYAAKGGKLSHGYKYAGGNVLNDVAWNQSNGGGTNHLIKGKTPNELGLYDMSGSVCEWCKDWDGTYSSTAQTNPTGAATGTYRIIRGGGWNTGGSWVTCRQSSLPDAKGDDLGFRLVLIQ